MVSGNFVAYYPVSTAQQGRSGLGLKAQQQAVRAYFDGGCWKLIGEHTEVESGKLRGQAAAKGEGSGACGSGTADRPRAEGQGMSPRQLELTDRHVATPRGGAPICSANTLVRRSYDQ
jgi:hypothetical protein